MFEILKTTFGLTREARAGSNKKRACTMPHHIAPGLAGVPNPESPHPAAIFGVRTASVLFGYNAAMVCPVKLVQALRLPA